MGTHLVLLCEWNHETNPRTSSNQTQIFSSSPTRVSFFEEGIDNNEENHERDDYIDKLADEVTAKQALDVCKKKFEKYIKGLKQTNIDQINAENQKKSDMTATLQMKLQQYIDLLSNMNEIDFIHD